MATAKRTAGAALVLTAVLIAGADVFARGRDEPLPPDAIARLGHLVLRHGDGISAVAFAPSGRSVATSGGAVVRLWDTTTGRELRAFEGHKDTVYDIAFSSDGKQLASAGMDTTIRIWEVAGGKTIHTLRLAGAGGRCIAFAPDGATLASGTWNGTVQLWDAKTGAELYRFHKSDDQIIAAVAFSPDGKTLAFTAHCLYPPGIPNAPPIRDATNTIHLWDVAAWKERRRWKVSGDGERSLAFSPDGKLLASAGQGVRLWRTASGEEVRQLKGATDKMVASAAFSQDGKFIATSGEKSAGLWSVQSGELVRRIDTEAQKFAFSRDGRLLATANGATLCLWDAKSLKQMLPADSPREAIYHLAWSLDGKTLASSGWCDHFRLWDVAAGTEVVQQAITLIGNAGAASFLDGKTLIAWQKDGIVRFNTATRQSKPVADVPKEVAFFAVSADGHTLAVEDTQENLRVLDLTRGKRRWEFSHQSETEQGKPSASGPRRALTLSADGRILALATEPRQPVRLWNIATGNALQPIEGLADWHHPVLFSPDGRTLVGWRENALRLCETVSGRERWRIEAKYGVLCAAWSPDGRVLATGGRDHLVRLWDLATAKEMHRLTGHRGHVMSLAFSPDGTRLASGSWDTTILIWDAAALRRRGAKPDRTLTDAEVAERWTDLSGRDAARAYRAIEALATAPRSSLAFLKDHLLPAPPTDPRIARLVANLDSDKFAVRERASRDLAEAGDAARTALRDVLDANPSLELRRRAEALLAKMGVESLPLTVLRDVRALEVLEQIGDAEATALLRRLAEGAPEARLTREAKASLERLAKRSARAR
ncbi:MAG TPA: WD40 repeat domain-containing protein [Gemmataceae bacterium]|jgi:WD40 repeat protein